MQEEVENRTVNLAISTTKLTGRSLVNAFRAYLNHRRNVKARKTSIHDTHIVGEQTDRSCYTVELDEKFCDVIVKRYIEQVGSSEDVSVQRDGLDYTYAEIAGNEGEDIPLF